MTYINKNNDFTLTNRDTDFQSSNYVNADRIAHSNV